MLVLQATNAGVRRPGNEANRGAAAEADTIEEQQLKQAQLLVIHNVEHVQFF